MKVLLELDKSTVEMADEAVALTKPDYASRRQFIEMAIRRESQAIKEKYESDRNYEISE